MLNPQSNYYDEELAEKRALASSYGRKSQANGAVFEELLALQLRQLDIDGIALLHKTGAPTKVTGRDANGKPRLVFTGEGPPDYMGVAMGYAVAFEAKSTEREDTWTVSNDHQYDFMVRYADHAPGAFVGYLIRWTKWEEVRWHSLYGKRYIREEGMLLPGGELKYIFMGG